MGKKDKGAKVCMKRNRQMYVNYTPSFIEMFEQKVIPFDMAR